MTIRCETLQELIQVTAGLVAQGVTFEAHTRNLSITLTGGY